MVTNNLKVIYTGYNPELDDKIINALKQAGFKWYAQGSDRLTNERDICFEYPEGIDGN